MVKFLKLYKIRILQIFILILVSLGSYFLLNNDMNIYKAPIGTIIKIDKDNKTPMVDQFGNKVIQHEQHLKIRIDNGKNENKIVEIINTANTSQAINQIFKVKQKVFIEKTDNNSWGITTMKRDQYWIPFMILILGSLVLLMGKYGKLTALSLLINIILFIITISLGLDIPNGNFFWAFGFFAIIASIITLGLVLGIKTKLMWTVTLTVLTTLLISILLTNIVFKVTNGKGLHLELMSFITQLTKPLFYSMTLVGILGAVMDEGTDMIATLYALIEQNKDITNRSIITAGRRVGQEIFGALTNVLFLIFISEEIPMVILYLHNGSNFSFTYRENLSVGS